MSGQPYRQRFPVSNLPLCSVVGKKNVYGKRFISKRSSKTTGKKSGAQPIHVEKKMLVMARVLVLALEAQYLVNFLEEAYKSGKLQNIICVPTSFQTKQWLIEAGLPVSDLDATPELDVCIDGADEVDSEYICIKGGGGCLAREKIVQNASSKFFVIADSSKESSNLGEHYDYVPVEVLPFAAQPLLKSIPRLFGGSANIRMASKKCGPVLTDNNNYIIDWVFEKNGKNNWRDIQAKMANIPGVVETGLFIDVVNSVYFANPDGSVKELTKK